MLYKYCTLIASNEIDLELFKVGTNLRTRNANQYRLFLDSSDSIIGLEIRSVNHMINKIIGSDLPILESCDISRDSGVTGALDYYISPCMLTFS